MSQCKICKSAAVLHGVADFNKSCEMQRGMVFPLAGMAIWYWRCPACGFLFTDQFDPWSLDDWRRGVYNADYARFDPDGADGSRARGNVPLVLDAIHQIGVAHVLDYGGGDGTLARLLCEAHSDAVSWDLLTDDGPLPAGPFGLVTAFEVMEHTPTPIETTRAMLSRLRDDGALLFSTLTLDDLPPQAMDHWYIAPRNGHVSIHTSRSLDVMFAAEGFQVWHLTAGLHMARRTELPGALA